MYLIFTITWWDLKIDLKRCKESMYKALLKTVRLFITLYLQFIIYMYHTIYIV